MFTCIELQTSSFFAKLLGLPDCIASLVQHENGFKMLFSRYFHTTINPTKDTTTTLSILDHATDDGEMERCHLLELPPELRLRIYDFYSGGIQTFCIVSTQNPFCDSAWHVYAQWERQLDEKSNQPSAGSNILRTCRTVYNEALPILHERTCAEFS